MDQSIVGEVRLRKEREREEREERERRERGARERETDRQTHRKTEREKRQGGIVEGRGEEGGEGISEGKRSRKSRSQKEVAKSDKT